MSVSDHIKDLYSDAYTSGGGNDWRELGAADKATNIISAWTGASFSGHPRVLEIGSGSGSIAAALSQFEFYSTYLGFDLSPSGVEEADSRSVTGATFRLSESDDLPVEDNSADLVVMSHVVEHLEHPRALLYEAKRIAPFTIVEVPLELNRRTPPDHICTSLGHINLYSAKTIRHLVQTCGFRVVSAVTTNPSRAVALYWANTKAQATQWQVKESALKLAPARARDYFTYHETLLLEREHDR